MSAQMFHLFLFALEAEGSRSIDITRIIIIFVLFSRAPLFLLFCYHKQFFFFGAPPKTGPDCGKHSHRAEGIEGYIFFF